MRNNGYVAPIDHGVVTTTVSAAGGAVEGGFKGSILWSAVLGLTPLVGAAIAFPFVAPLAGAFIIAASCFASVAGAVAGGGLGAIVGAWGGGKKAIEQVKLEKGLSNQMQAQVDIMRSQAIMQSNSRGLNVPAQYNTASSTVNKNSMQFDGPVMGAELAAAR